MKKKKRSITLIELLIVILLIGMIGGALAFNMKGSLDKGKKFKSEEGIRTIQDILLLEVAQGVPMTEVVEKWETKVRESPLAGRPDDLIKDGWGDPYLVSIKDDTIEVKSKNLK